MRNIGNIWRYAVSVFGALILVSASVFAYGSEESAQVTVQKATDQLIAKLLEIRPVYSDNPDLFFSELQAALDPYIDFERFSRGVMAKYYRTIPDADKARFEQVFKSDLVRTYGKSLVEFDNEEIVVLPSDGSESGRPDEEPVKLEVHSKDGKIYQVEYRMSSRTGSWKLINVTVDGINLGLIFRNQFLALMDENNGDLDKVIQQWNSKVGEGTT